MNIETKQSVIDILHWIERHGEMPVEEIRRVNAMIDSPLAPIVEGVEWYPYALCDLARQYHQDGHHILEIGLGAGGCHQRIHCVGQDLCCEVYGIDNGAMASTDLSKVVKLVRDVDGIPRIYLMDSRIAAEHWQVPLFLLFIDGGHEYDIALSDYENFSRWVCKGGLIAIHDLKMKSIARLIRERLDDFETFYFEPNEGKESMGMFYGIKGGQ